MAVTSADYLAQLQSLLPSGLAWPRDADAVLTHLLAALAEELTRIDGRAEQLVSEADPRTTIEMLSDWERFMGLPDPCVGGSQTIEQRRQALVARLSMAGGQTRQYFIDLAAALGSAITITEFDAFTVLDTVADPINGTDWNFAWQVNGVANPVTYMTVNGAVNDPLSWWGTTAVQCVLNRFKPAHTVVIFNYI